MEGLEVLAHWYSQATRLFPPPITIDGDDVQESISIFANMLFCCSATAVPALRLLIFHLREKRSGLEQSQQLLDDDAEAMVAVFKDFRK
jgi:hypothetical protein